MAAMNQAVDAQRSADSAERQVASAIEQAREARRQADAAEEQLALMRRQLAQVDEQRTKEQLREQQQVALSLTSSATRVTQILARATRAIVDLPGVEAAEKLSALDEANIFAPEQWREAYSNSLGVFGSAEEIAPASEFTHAVYGHNQIVKRMVASGIDEQVKTDLRSKFRGVEEANSTLQDHFIGFIVGSLRSQSGNSQEPSR